MPFSDQEDVIESTFIEVLSPICPSAANTLPVSVNVEEELAGIAETIPIGAIIDNNNIAIIK